MGDLLAGKVAIVTGSGRGIGRAHAFALAAEGAKVVVNDLGVERDGTGGSSSPADEVVAAIREQGGEAVASYGSVADFEAARASFRRPWTPSAAWTSWSTTRGYFATSYSTRCARRTGTTSSQCT